jgi:hypothetical protein
MAAFDRGLEFLNGRFYQLVKDRSLNVPMVPGRADLARVYMTTLTVEDIEKEAREIALKNVINKKNPNGWNNFEINPPIYIGGLAKSECFELGRSFQFILDTNARFSIQHLNNLSYQKIKEVRDRIRLHIFVDIKNARKEKLDDLASRYCYKNCDEDCCDDEYNDSGENCRCFRKNYKYDYSDEDLDEMLLDKIILPPF